MYALADGIDGRSIVTSRTVLNCANSDDLVRANRIPITDGDVVTTALERFVGVSKTRLEIVRYLPPRKLGEIATRRATTWNTNGPKRKLDCQVESLQQRDLRRG